MEIRKRFHKNIAILYITGKIDVDSAIIIEETGKLLKEGIQKILCNFANVGSVDYNGLSVLTIAYKNIINQKGVLKFCNMPAHIKELLKAARLDTVFDIHNDEREALKGFEISSRIDKMPLRRRFKRIDANVPIKYKIGLSASEKLFRGKILNLSGEGVFIYSKDTFPASTQLYIEIALEKTKKPLALAGVVIWVADKEIQPHAYPGMGVLFVSLEKSSQARIIDFIDKNLIGRSKV